MVLSKTLSVKLHPVDLARLRMLETWLSRQGRIQRSGSLSEAVRHAIQYAWGWSHPQCLTVVPQAEIDRVMTDIFNMEPGAENEEEGRWCRPPVGVPASTPAETADQEPDDPGTGHTDNAVSVQLPNRHGGG